MEAQIHSRKGGILKGKGDGHAKTAEPIDMPFGCGLGLAQGSMY